MAIAMAGGALAPLSGCGNDDGAGTGSGTEGMTESGGEAGPSTTASTGAPSTTDDSTPATTSDPSTTTSPTDPTMPPSTTTPDTDTASPTDTDGDTDEPTTGDPTEGSFAACYEDVFVNGFPVPNYDQHGINVGSHCVGSDHQEIDDIERVVFLGDSVTVGTPPTATEDYYRVKLADALADRFALQFGGNKGLWQLVNVIDGTALARDSGDFSSCAKWGARNDDLLAGNQLNDCFPEAVRDRKTLTVMTSGGNDLAKIAREATDGAEPEALWELAESAVDHKRDSLMWLTDPANFPNGNHVVFGNVYEFTDGTGELGACEFSGLAGFDGGAPLTPDALLIVAWIQDQYAQLAVETGSDFIFMFEEFCGHGFNADDPQALCYRGPGNANWFDLTCIHPTPAGHGVLADMFLATISE